MNRLFSFRRGISLVEVLITIAIVGILMFLLLYAILAGRESARDASCKNNLRQIGIACLNFENAKSKYPIHSLKAFSVQAILLPYMGSSTFEVLDFGVLSYAEPNRKVIRHNVAAYYCPSNPVAPDQFYAANQDFVSYIANLGSNRPSPNDGAFGDFRNRSLSTFRDGTSTTLAFVEAMTCVSKTGAEENTQLGGIYQTERFYNYPEEEAEFIEACLHGDNFRTFNSLGQEWKKAALPGTYCNTFLPPNSPNCLNRHSARGGNFSASSQHGGIVNCQFVDGSVRGVSEDVSREIWQAMGTISKGEVLSE